MIINGNKNTTDNKKKNTKPATPEKQTNKKTQEPKPNGGQPEKSRASRVLELQKKDLHAHRQVSAVILFSFALLCFFVVLIPGANLWDGMRKLMFGFFGIVAYLWPVALTYLAVICTLDKLNDKVRTKLGQLTGLVCLLCSLIFIFNNHLGHGYFADIKNTYLSFSHTGGGAVGACVGGLLLRMFGVVPAAVVAFLLVFVFLMLSTGTTLITLFRTIWSPVKKVEEKATVRMEQFRTERTAKNFNIDVPIDTYPINQQPVSSEATPRPTSFGKRAFFDVPVDMDPVAPVSDPESVIPDKEKNGKSEFLPIDDIVKSSLPAPLSPEKILAKAKANAGTESVAPEIHAAGETEEITSYRFPPIDLLKASEPDTNTNVEDELKNNAAQLVETLRSFNVETTVIGISRGPAVTRYELKPASGVKINKITNLADDIALNLAASGVRIEAPIPNKSAVGIEIPNRTTGIVSMRELIDSQPFKTAKSKLTVTLGKNITGSVTITDLAKMPHLLIAGSTGSGKSVCINSLIVSILYKASPDEVKLLMIDPKVVELGVYNGIPHLLVPVVTDPRKASGALSWAVSEMLNRYKIFADNNVRDLSAYNRMCVNHPDKKPLPQVVIIIDELADLMMAAPNEVEDSICRLAQMARAAGMHLVIATQRPSVDVITGIIKANIPSRIAFAVSSQVDSRTILDTSGAEKLLGRGDMLFYPVGAAKPTRIQGCFVTDTEIESIIDYVKHSSNVEECVYDEEIAKEIERQAAPEKKKGAGAGTDTDADSDELFPQAVECVVEAGTASTTLLQRRLRLGYARAARIMDELESKGIVSPAEGSKQRKVLITKQQWLEMYTRSNDE